MTAPLSIAVVGLGKIAHDQHLPAIRDSAGFQLAAIVSKDGSAVEGLPGFRDIEDLASSGLAIDAVSICTPPQVRHDLAQFAVEQGWHVFLEKPPGATLAEVVALRDTAAERGVSLFASWHSRYAPGVEPAKAWLAGRRIERARIVWREDVRVWHPGQDWIWQAGGFGVFDPGINALSIATHILPLPMFVEQAELLFPANRAAPIAAQVMFRDRQGTPIAMDLDFRQEGPQQWDIIVETDGGTLTLSQGGAVLAITGGDATGPTGGGALNEEYPALYRRFAEIVQAGMSDVDLSPLQLVADAFLRGRITQVDAFVE